MAERGPPDKEILRATVRLVPLFRQVPQPDQLPSRPPLSLGDSDAQRLVLLLRAGRVDLERISRVLDRGLRPAGLVVNLTEASSVIADARRIAARFITRFMGDPVFHRLTLDSYETTPGMRRLAYRPPQGHGPWRAEQFSSVDACAELARGVIDQQMQVGVGIALGVGLAVHGPEDPWIARAPELIRQSLLARNAWGNARLLVPIAPLVSGFTDVRAQVELVRRLRSGEPEGYLLMADGVGPASSSERIFAALRLAVLLQSGGPGVIWSRCGPLRYLATPFGLRGFENALGRLERVDLRDHQGGGGGGHNPPRFEFPSLLGSLHRDLAAVILAARVTPEADCDCDSCAAASTVEEQLAGTVEHNGAMLGRHLAAEEERSLPERLARVQQALRDGRWLLGDIVDAGIDVGRELGHLNRWPLAIELALQAGLDEPARLARAVGLD